MKTATPHFGSPQNGKRADSYIGKVALDFPTVLVPDITDLLRIERADDHVEIGKYSHKVKSYSALIRAQPSSEPPPRSVVLNLRPAVKQRALPLCSKLRLDSTDRKPGTVVYYAGPN